MSYNDYELKAGTVFETFGVIWAKGFKRFCMGFAGYQRSLIFEGYTQISLGSLLSLAKCVMMCLGNKKP